MKPRKYYIEFVGQHTAGKTTTIREVVDAQLLAPHVAMYPQQIERSSVRFYAALPMLIATHIGHVYFLASFLARYAVVSWINYHAVVRHLFKMVLLHPFYERYDFDVWMKDDMLHLLPRLEFKQGVDVASAFTTFFNHFAYRYSGLVYMDVSYAVMRERFEKRFKERSEARRINRMPVYERSFAQTCILRDVICAQKRVPVLMLDGTDAIHTNAEKVATFIKTRVLTA